MATRLPKQFNAGTQLTASAATYYTVPANTVSTISAMTIINTTGTARYVTIYLVPNAGAATAADTLIYQRVIAAGESWNVLAAIGQSLPAGATIQALAEVVSALTIIASGYETTP